MEGGLAGDGDWTAVPPDGDGLRPLPCCAVLERAASRADCLAVASEACSVGVRERERVRCGAVASFVRAARLRVGAASRGWVALELLLC